MLVSAPAGFGKTTSSPSGWARHRGDRSVAWLSLGQEDNEPAAFWTYVVTALHGAVPDIGSTALELVAVLPCRPSTCSPRCSTSSPQHLARSGWSSTTTTWSTAPNQRRDGLPARAPPAQVHVVLSTRADPDLPLARWRVRGELVEIRAADLRFTDDEAAAYLNEAAGLGLDASGRDALAERTEGWIAALQLAALSLQGREDVSGFIARFAGDDRYIVDYLVEEVLAHQPEPVREFLLRSAVLDRLTGPLCDAVTGREDGQPTCSSPSSAPTCSSSRWTISGSGTATTTCSPTCCGRACSASSRSKFRCCTGAPAGGMSATV